MKYKDRNGYKSTNAHTHFKKHQTGETFASLDGLRNMARVLCSSLSLSLSLRHVSRDRERAIPACSHVVAGDLAGQIH